MFTSTQLNTVPLYDSSFAYAPPKQGASRSPCPALNALANHGYISRDGTNIPFWTLLNAIRNIYNLSFPLALVLTIVGYLTSGTFSFWHRPKEESEPAQHNVNLLATIIHSLPCPSWTLDLASLCTTGPYKIAHNASLVHADIPGSTSDPVLVEQLLTLAHHHHQLQSPSSPYTKAVSTQINPATPASNPNQDDGLTLCDLGCLHAEREDALPLNHKLSHLHEQVALGECGLAWCVMRTHDEDPQQGIIPARVLKQWFGEERIPDGWWDGGRPVKEVGLKEAARRAAEVGLFKDSN